MSRSTTNRAFPIAAAMAVGAVLGAAAVAGTGGLATASATSTGAGAEASAAAGEETAAADAGHDHGTTAASDAAAEPLVPLAVGCDDSDLPAHDGNQAGPACVSTLFGEVGAAEDNPQLLITDAPDEVTVGQPFTLQVSTRNLVRDRFLPAAQGGYYLESSTLDENGIVRGHFHTACRVLGDADVAPEPVRQDVFVATEDGGGGATPDTVTVEIPGLAAAGQAQCTAWAGDGSHRIPMMVFANQMPAVDSVRIQVAADDAAEAPADDAAAADAGADEAAEAPQGTGQRADAAERRATETPRRDETPRRPETPQRTATDVDAGTPADSETADDADTETASDPVAEDRTDSDTGTRADRSNGR
ncbi:hypothetical protein ACI782_07660 [Geodermatophilus sp. SYSU D00703]